MGDEGSNCNSSTRNFHICNARVRTMRSSHPDGWSRIGNFLLWWTRVQTIAIRRPDGYIWIEILALRRCASRRDTTSSGRLIDLPFLGTWKEIENWSSTERHSDVLLKRPDGCKLAQKLLDTVWGPDGMNTFFGRMMLICLGGPDGWHSGQMGVRTGWLDRPDGWRGTWNSSDLQAELSDITLNRGIPVYIIFILKWFCPNTEWGQNTNRWHAFPYTIR
jgi:hypothetical protein